MRLDSVLPTDFWGSRVPSIRRFTNVYRGVREGEGPQLCEGAWLLQSEAACGILTTSPPVTVSPRILSTQRLHAQDARTQSSLQGVCSPAEQLTFTGALQI